MLILAAYVPKRFTQERDCPGETFFTAISIAPDGVDKLVASHYLASAVYQHSQHG
jgi:hypothetical protein